VTATTEVRITDPETGGQKGTKPERYDLIPVDALAEFARVYGFGATKYEDHNYLKGYKWSLSIAALHRHIAAWVNGESDDDESGHSHLMHAAWHCFALYMFELHGLGTDDRWTPPADESVRSWGPGELAEVQQLMDRVAAEVRPPYVYGAGGHVPVTPRKRVYLAGPMTGIPQFNFPAFDAAAEELRGLGYDVVSPAELDSEETREAALASADGAPGSGSTTDETWGDFLARDVKLIADGGIEGVVVLPGWQRSRGARLETFIARALHGYPVYASGDLSPVSLPRLALAWVMGR
jgi:hypothetical protein